MATALAVVASTGAVAFAYTRINDDAAQKTQHVPQQKRKPLKVKGKVEGLTPGETAPFTVTVRNNLKHRIKLRSVEAKVADANPACPRTLLRVPKVKTGKALRARKTRRVRMQATLAREASNACQSAKFPVRYRVRFRLRPHAQ
jgi:hypothetical protein